MKIGIDIGGTFVKMGVVSDTGKITNSEKYPTKDWSQSFDFFLESITKAINKLSDGEEITGIGIGIPGHLSVDRRQIIECPNVSVLKKAMFIDELEVMFPDIPIKMENDSNCATLCEMRYGRLLNLKSYLLITLGTGVGSGLVIDRKLFTGPSGNACEIGMIPMENGVFLEELIGQQQIADYATAKLATGDYKSSSLRSLEKITPKDIHHAATKGDQLALDTFHFVGTQLGKAFVTIMHLYDVHTIVLAGGIAGAFDLLVPAAKAELARRCDDYYTDDLVILKATMEADSGVVGAASLLVQD